MRVVTVVGYRDSGKTTLVERLIPALGEDTRVATVKSIHHDVEVDTPGKDTYRHRAAGADTVVGVTPSQTFQIGTAGSADGVTLEDVIDDLSHSTFDVVIAEGFKDSPFPSIVLGGIDATEVGGTIIHRTAHGATADLVPIVDAIWDLPRES